ncbi:MAG: alpha/beta hydrolase, partial [Planktomarina sp.]|nr:alpha/beta hydrolase [Planktomarina sp.]
IQAMSGIDEAAFRQVVNCLVTFNRLNDQHRITQPCFLIAGSHDTNSPPRIMEKMAKKLPDATIKIIKNTGHLVNSEAPNEVNKLLTSFYKNLCLQNS